jgi:hypothetical protein
VVEEIRRGLCLKVLSGPTELDNYTSSTGSDRSRVSEDGEFSLEVRENCYGKLQFLAVDGRWSGGTLTWQL